MPRGSWRRRAVAGAAQAARHAGPRPDAQSVFIRLRCERGAEIAAGLGFPRGPPTRSAASTSTGTARAIRRPARRGDPERARIMCLAQTVDVFMTRTASRAPWPSRANGAALVRPVARRPAGRRDVARRCRSRRRVGGRGDRVRARRARARGRRRARRPRRRRVRGPIDAKSPSTAGHSHRVAALVVAAAEQLGQPASRDVERAALLHDIGKLSLSSRLLDKPGRLTEPEWAAVRAHPLHTERLLSRSRRCGRGGDRRGAPRATGRQRLPAWAQRRRAAAPRAAARGRRRLRGDHGGAPVPCAAAARGGERHCATRRGPAAWTTTASRRWSPRSRAVSG